jgi:hypothetical protein
MLDIILTTIPANINVHLAKQTWSPLSQFNVVNKPETTFDNLPSA